jgi:phosphoribosylaminoimidazole-succinocarboxamide synthase
VLKNLSRKYGFAEGTMLSVPVIEYHYKNEKLKNPMVNETHLGALDLISQEEVIIFNRMIAKTNAVLKTYFERRGLFLVELHLSFGRYKGNLYIGDEISPDTCQFWGINGEDNFDKELYRQEKANSDIPYKKIVERLKGSIAS